MRAAPLLLQHQIVEADDQGSQSMLMLRVTSLAMSRPLESVTASTRIDFRPALA